jgi:hypothetical protein
MPDEGAYVRAGPTTASRTCLSHKTHPGASVGHCGHFSLACDQQLSCSLLPKKILSTLLQCFGFHPNAKRWYAVCMETAVAYYRVSTKRQQRFGLGIDAQ